MNDTSRQVEVSQLLRRVSAGDRGAFDRLFALVYDELRTLARIQRRRRGRDDSLNTTALVHEAYLRLVGQDAPDWRDRSHFHAVAATAMRHILIDHARRAQASKRGGQQAPLSLDRLEASLQASGEQLLTDEPELLVALDEVLKRLELHSEREVRIVECRFFAGMTVPETAEALEISTATVKRGWSMAQAWLYREMRHQLEDGVTEGTA